MIPLPLLRARICALLATALCTVTPAAAQPSDTDWTVATGNQASQRYAPLSQIDASNVEDLVEVWRWQSPDVALVAADKKLQSRRMQLGSHEVSPLKVGDRLYVTTGYSQLAAIDAATGKTLWIYDPKAYETGRPPNLGFVHRGATYWTDAEGRGRVVYATGNAYLHAVDAFTGEPIGGFGDGGTVDLTQGLRRKVSRRGYGVSSPVIACNGTFIVGSSISDGQTHPEAAPGDVRGFDAETGKQLWSFHSIPQEGELGNETWLDDSWKLTGNTNVWTLMSADPELGMVYLPFGTPTNDWYGGHRRGDNLFAESVVAVDCRTGERRWHFQTTHHGVWDYDLVTSPILGDVEVEGRTVAGLFQLTKQGFVFAFDRSTGEPIWPIEERAVPQSDVPGELTSPTQPFPTKPPPYERQGVTVDDLIDFTPDLHAEAREILSKYRVGPIYTPPSTDKLTLNLPGWAGGSSWQGGGFDPKSGLLFVPSFTLPIAVKLQKPDPSRSGFDWVAELETVVLGPRGLPLLKPPYSRLTAYDMNRGEIAWVQTLGDGPKDHPELADLDLEPLGTIARSHVLVTDTLLFVNSSAGLGRGYSPEVADPKAFLRAFDKTTGELVLERTLDANTDGSPVSYLHEGRQYVVFALGGREEPAEIVAYALPEGAGSR